MIVIPGDRCVCRYADGIERKCIVLRGPLPPAHVAPKGHPSMSSSPYRYEIRLDDGSVEVVGEPRLIRISGDDGDVLDPTG